MSIGGAVVPYAVRLREPLAQVVADAQRVRHDRQRRIHRAGRGKEARVDDIQVVQVVRFAVPIQR